MPRLLRPDEKDPGVIVTYVRPATADDPLVYVKTGKASYIKVKLTEAAAFCAAHGIAREWETREERTKRRAREQAATPAPEPGTRAAFAATPHRED